VASKIDIWNTALSHLGHKANITDPDEVSAEANHCRRFYPIALGTTLERFAWSFAMRRVALAEVTNPVDHWMFAYGLPNPCVAVRAVLPPACTDDTQEQEYAIEADENNDAVLYTNQEAAVLKYTTRIEDTTKFSPLFVMAVSAELAALLAGPIPKDPKKRQEMQQLAIYYIGLAEANNANSGQSSRAYDSFTPSHLAAR
jgi:hypothetical protein